MYLCKSININFFITFKVLAKFQESSSGKAKPTGKIYVLYNPKRLFSKT